MEKQKRRITAAGIGLILFVVGGYLLLTLFMNPTGAGSGEFASYAGPVLPMTSLGGAQGVTVSRSVDFDFSPYETGGDYSNLGKGGALITDACRLTNTNSEPVTTTLVYGFQGQFIDEPEEFPVITVDGETIQPQLRPSVDPDGGLWHAHNYEVYKAALREQDFLTIALAEPEAPEVAMTAYHFTDLACNGDKIAGYPMLQVDFRVDEHTAVWTNRADVLGTDDETGKQMLMFRVDRGEGWIFTIGGELLDLKFSGNRDHNINEDSAIDVEYKMEVFETDLATVIAQFAESYDFWAEQDWYSNAGGLTPEILTDSALKRIEAQGWLEPSDRFRVIEDLFYETVTEHRMMYLVFPVELRPGQTVAVSASYVQEPSYDIGGPKKYREGYDMATKLGSDLDFVDLGASVSNTDPIRITEQNFGFDPEEGVTEVALDLNVERYYMVVHLKE